ncbi:GNAT family N-acetyltransferase [Alkalihalobacillus hemicellulosilyticus]|uniref:Acetyltransferase n=1 Tax=Halalkalibacter hemicellulosilyticusJCM 9152 TaxID=1236971 RepID=W4QEJ0_9BACI|nr:GNAT family N-acetyltransferase [Halalkalibacter hemicellulosilyticus]GAE30490.1 acetyltransferase [Halalkalibacter hemicellulosilyticusJCM 9152]
MITELSKQDYHKCKRLLHKKSLKESLAIINGMNPGRIFVDDELTPTTAIVWLGNNDGFIFIGDANNKPFLSELNFFIDDIIIPEAKNVHLDCFEAISDHAAWNQSIEEVLGHRQLESWNQRVYKIDPNLFQGKVAPTLPNDYHVVMLNEHASLEADDYVTATILEFWTSFDHFFANGFGYIVTHHNQTVSICLSTYVADHIHCVSIKTDEAYREKKLAQAVAYHYVQHSLNHNLIPYWDCMEENKPSIAIVEKLGFEQVLQYKGYFFSFS